jgi:hypothetical protein
MLEYSFRIQAGMSIVLSNVTAWAHIFERYMLPEICKAEIATPGDNAGWFIRKNELQSSAEKTDREISDLVSSMTKDKGANVQKDIDVLLKRMERVMQEDT